MAFGINSITISGNLTRDPDVHSGHNDRGEWTIVNMRIAWNFRKKEGDEWVDEVNYFDVKMTGGTAKWVGQNVSKGDRIVVQGQLRWREWEDKEGGKRQQTYIDARNVVTEGSGSSDGSSRSRSSSSSSSSSAPPDDGPPAQTEGPSQAADDIPF